MQGIFRIGRFLARSSSTQTNAATIGKHIVDSWFHICLIYKYLIWWKGLPDIRKNAHLHSDSSCPHSSMANVSEWKELIERNKASLSRIRDKIDQRFSQNFKKICLDFVFIMLCIEFPIFSYKTLNFNQRTLLIDLSGYVFVMALILKPLYRFTSYHPYQFKSPILI